MTQREIFRKIDGILRELNDQSVYLQSGDDFLNDLELELFMANANFLTDHVEILRKLNNQLIKNAEKQKAQAAVNAEPASAMVEIVKPEVPAASVEFDLKKKDDNQERTTPSFFIPEVEQAITPVVSAPDPAYEDEKKTEPIIRHEIKIDELPPLTEEEDAPEEHQPAPPPPVFVRQAPPVVERKEEVPRPVAPPIFEPVVSQYPESVPAPVAEPVKVAEPKREEPVPVTHIGTQIKIEETKDEQKVITINQILSSQKAASVAGAQPIASDLPKISDLKSAITLNDKLLFIRDLFNNYSLAYSEAIDILNRFNSFEEADQFLVANYRAKNHWESKQATVDKLYDLLHRRFA